MRCYLHREVDAIVERDLVEIEVEDDLARADRLDMRRTEANMEVRVVLASEGPVTAVLSETDGPPIGWLSGRTSREHSGLEPGRRQIGVDLLDGRPMNILEGQESAAHQGVVNGEAEPVIIEVGQGEKNMVAGMMEEVEVLGDVERECISAGNGLGCDRDNLRPCKVVKNTL